MNESKSEIITTLIFSGFEQTPDEVSNLFGIEATTIHEIGGKSNLIPHLVYKENFWGWRVTDNILMKMPDQLDLLLKKLNPLKENLMKFSKINPPMLEIVIKSYCGDRPLITYSNEIIKFLADLNSETVIDLYIFD